ncbi:MAG: ROK family protein [Actinomycetota bacterium]
MSPAIRAAIGVDIGGTGTKAGVIDERGEILARVERPTDTSAGTKSIIAAVEDLLQRLPELNVEVAAIGVGAAGFIDHENGSVSFSPNLTYDDPHIADALRSRVGLPVTVDNDANAAAWGERTFGTAKGSDHVAMLTIGTGIGSGFVVEGRLIRGFRGAGAEFGHVVIDPQGPPCSCGLRGCLEQMASGTAIARMGRAAVEEDPSSSIVAFSGGPGAITAEHVAKAAREYDETARAILRRAGEALGLGLSNVVNVFDPEVIVLGGGAVEIGEPFLGPARDRLVELTDAQHRRPMRLDLALLENNAGMVGAASLALGGAS